MAVAKFPVDPLKLNAVGNLTAAGTPVTITVTGENFGDNMTAEWIDPAKKTVTPIPPDKIKKKSDKEAEITLTPGPTTGQGALILISANQLRASAPVQVQPPGPVIQELLVRATALTRDAQGQEQPVELTIDLKGENLSTDAAVKIDGVQLRPKDEFTIEDLQPPKPQNAPADPSFRAEVNVVLKNAAKYVQGQKQYELTFINTDGQMAVAKFPVDPLKLNAVGNLTAAGTPVTITVTGENFSDNMTAEWIDPAKTVTVIAPDKIKKKSDKEAEITLTPGPTKGQGVLILISANQLRASAPVLVQ
jgi:hypothetical protein